MEKIKIIEIVVEQSSDSYGAYANNVAGITAHADTIDEIINQIAESVVLHRELNPGVLADNCSLLFTQIDVSDEDLVETYMEGFADQLIGYTKCDNYKGFELRAYNLGWQDAINGEDKIGYDESRQAEVILNEIKTYE